MSKTFFSIAALLVAAVASAEQPKSESIGVVNFSNCVTDSKAGAQEQENMETLRRQWASMIETTDKELRELSAKFEDTEFLDSLSPKAEEELRTKHQSLQEDLMRYQQQFYQMMNHANYQMVHKLRGDVEVAAAKVAKEKNLRYILNEELCFYAHPDMDITTQVVVEMDREFDNQAQASSVEFPEEIQAQ